MDTAKYLQDLAATEKKQKQVELDQARAAALTEIGREEAKIKPVYTQQRQQASVQSQLGAKNFAEFLASRGQTRAGLSSQAELSRQNVLGNQLSDIQTAENTAMTNVANQRADVNTQYTNNLTNAYNQIGAKLSENLYNDKLRQIQRQQELADRQKSFQQEVYLRNLSNRSNTDRTGKINKLQGTTLDRNAVLGAKGVPDATGKKMIWSIPQSDGSITQVSFAKGVNPFTGSINSSLYTIDKKSGKKVLDLTRAMSNGYQPKYVTISKKVKEGGILGIGDKTVNKKVEVAVKPTGKKTTMFGIEQEIYKVAPNYYMVWDGANNKYIRV